MNRDIGRRECGSSIAARSGKVRRQARKPAVEPLEDRQLLTSFYPGLTTDDPVQTPSGVYTLTLTGPGVERVSHAAHGQITVTLLGTTSASTLSVAMTHQRLHAASTPLQIASIKVKSGQIGGISAPGAVLNGSITGLNGAVSTLQFGSLGSNAQIDVNGSVGSLAVSGSAVLGPSGHVKISGDINQGLSVGALSLAGGRFVVTHNIAAPVMIGQLGLSNGGQFLVGHDVTGNVQVTGNMTVAGNSLFSVGHNLTGSFSVGQNLTLDSGGQVSVGNDLTGAFNVGGGLSISNHSRLIVNRDLTSTATISGDLDLAAGGALIVNRTLNTLTVNGNLNVSTGAGVAVGGDLTKLTVGGAFAGQGSATQPDLNVGLNLGALNVLGGGANQGGLQSADINVGKSINSVNVVHGIFYSLITAGVSINGGSPSGNNASNIGADGTNAVLNSEIRAGISIDNLTIGGDVRSTFATNAASAGYPTRIIAGEDRAGNFSNGGLIDNFQITGALIDSVLAASVAPYGDHGTLPTSAYGSPPPFVGPPPGDLGFNTYDAPAGTITGGTVGNPILYQNYSEAVVQNEKVTGVAYDTTLDPTIDDTILFGAINPSFASAPLSQATLSGNTSVTTNQGTTNNGSQSTVTVSANDQAFPLPTKSTVLGGVISTLHGDEADYAGIFAADARGVFVGTLPS